MIARIAGHLQTNRKTNSAQHLNRGGVDGRWFAVARKWKVETLVGEMAGARKEETRKMEKNTEEEKVKEEEKRETEEGKEAAEAGAFGGGAKLDTSTIRKMEKGWSVGRWGWFSDTLCDSIGAVGAVSEDLQTDKEKIVGDTLKNGDCKKSLG